MSFIYNIINIPLGYALRFLSDLFGGNFASAVFVFTLLINLILLPLTIKSQRATANQARLKPKLDALRKKCGDDRQKFAQEQQALYQRENVSMAGGCLPMIVRLVIMLGVYNVIVAPMVYLVGINQGIASDAAIAAQNLGFIKNVSYTSQISLLNAIKQGTIEVAGISPSALGNIDFNFFGLNLTETPVFGFNIFGGDFQPIWLIPILSGVTAVASSLISMKLQKISNPDAPSMGAMMLLMPIVSLVIAFSVPGAVGFYWAASNLISGGLQAVVQLMYGPDKVIARDRAKAVIKKYRAEQGPAKKEEPAVRP